MPCLRRDYEGYVKVTREGGAGRVAVPALSFEQARQLAMYLNGLLDRSRGRDVALVAYVKEFLPRSEDRFVAVENGLARIRELPPAPAGYGEFGAGRAA